MDNNPIKIVVKQDIPLTFEAISTVFYIQIGDFCFPDSEWTDLSFSVLQMWTYKLVSATSQSIDLYFLDGPFWLKIQQLRDGEINLCFMHDDKMIRQEVSALNRLYIALIDAYDQLLSIVRNEHIEDKKKAGLSKDITGSISALKAKLLTNDS
ncbi:MAG: hypothetical protein IJZ08_02345 [Clostridia bacterium]|nr:hypothetical protein [Clostridia bacterium]